MPATTSGHYNPHVQIAAGRAARQRLLALCVDETEATAAGFKSITQGWSTRRYDQCMELDRAVKEMGAVDFKLVLKEGRISIWRKK